MPALLCQFAGEGVTFPLFPGERLKAFGALTDDLRAKIRARKAAILAELRTASNPKSRWKRRQELIEILAGAPVEAILRPWANRELPAALPAPETAAPQLGQPGRRTTPAEAKEPRRLITLNHANDSDADRADALLVETTNRHTAGTSLVRVGGVL